MVGQRAPRTPHASRRPKLVQRVRRGDSYVLVLALIVGDYCVLSLADVASAPWSGIAVLATAMTLLAAMRTSRTNATLMHAAMAAGVTALLLAVLNTAVESRAVAGTVVVTIGVLLLAAPLAILERIMRHPAVTLETLAGAVDVYLLLGLTFAAVYAAVGILAPPFFVQATHAGGNDFVYFSYVTLATLGYGDLTPAASLGRTLAVMEAMSGQVYLVTVVARLVASLVTQR